MHSEGLIRRLEPFPGGLSALLAVVTPDEARFRPPSGAWSIVEIVNHLIDEEVDDFRARVRSTLEDPSRDWAPIDPEGWARQRRYQDRELGPSLERFAAERRASVAWLRSLRGPDWTRAAVHPKFGAMHAGMLLASWAAHDALHLRQIAKRLHELAGRDGNPYTTLYGGEWRA
jgi:hypothetical protein